MSAVRRRLNRIRLDKIAAVDSPCQQHATVGIVKRAPEPLTIAKATFQEALDAAEVSQAVSRAFYDSFDGLWTQNDAFRTALTDELSAGGDGTEASDAYVASVKSLVDRAVEQARSAGVKAESGQTPNVDKVLNEAASAWLAEKSSPKEGSVVMKITSKAALLAEVAKFDPATSPAAHIDIIRKAATDLDAEDALPADGPLAKAAPDPAIAKMTREIAVLKLAPDAKSYFDGLDEAGQTAFLGKSADEQTAAVAKANETDPIVYTTKGGLGIRKSEGATVLALAKQNDELVSEVTALRGETQSTTLEKRAVEEFPHVAKGVAVSMLKSAAQLGVDTEAGKGILASLDSMNKTADPVFKRLGSSSGADTIVPQGVAKARQTFAAEVDKIAKRDSITKAAAMEKAETEVPELFAEAYPAVEPAAATADAE